MLSAVTVGGVQSHAMELEYTYFAVVAGSADPQRWKSLIQAVVRVGSNLGSD